MVLRTRKSLGRISALFGNGMSKRQRPSPSHLIWILLSSAASGAQYAATYTSSVDRLRQALSIEKGIASVIQLQNTSPACALSGSRATSAKASPASLLVCVDGEDAFKATLQKTRALLEYGEIAFDAFETRILHWSLSTYSCVQTYEPKRSKAMFGTCIVIVAIDPTEGQDEDVDSWYRTEHLAQLSTNSLFLQCKRYTRILDPSSVIQDDVEGAAKFLAVHDYTSVQALIDHSVS